VSWRRVFGHCVPALRWLAIVWVVVFWRLGYSSLLDPDEAHYAELTREMMQSGNWLVPLLDGHPFIDKPVLFHWLQGASVLLLGETEFAARLPTALAALALIAVTRWVGRALFSPEVGNRAAMMFAVIPATFALSGVAVFDMVFALFLFGAVGCLLVAARMSSRRLELGGYALLTLAVMTKGPVALVLIGLLFVTATLASSATRAQVSRLRWKIGLPAVALAASPWFVWMGWHFGADFVQGYLFAGNLFYFTQPVEFSTRAINHTFYVRAFAGAFFPWSIIVIGRGIDLIRRFRSSGAISSAEGLLWLWTLVVIGFFSIARFKLDHYIFPAAPACCLIAANAWYAAARDQEGRLVWTHYGVLAVAGAMIVGGSFAGVYLSQIDLALPPTALVLPVAIMAGGVGLLFQAERRRWHVPAGTGVLVTALLVSYATVDVVGFPVLERVRPTARAARILARSTPPTAPVGLYKLERWRGSIRYYLHRPVQRLETVEDARAFLARAEPVYVVMLRREYLELREQHVPVYLMTAHRAVVGTTGRGMRKQRWGFLVVVTNVPQRGTNRYY
jgi:4-amino-4-deoxy-L-arabinose transferase-like glycosyltransferase